MSKYTEILKNSRVIVKAWESGGSLNSLGRIPHGKSTSANLVGGANFWEAGLSHTLCHECDRRYNPHMTMCPYCEAHNPKVKGY